MSWTSPCFLAGWIWFGSRPGSRLHHPRCVPQLPSPHRAQQSHADYLQQLFLLHHGSLISCYIVPLCCSQEHDQLSGSWLIKHLFSHGCEQEEVWGEPLLPRPGKQVGAPAGGSASMKWFLWYPYGRVKRGPFSAQSSFFPNQQTTTAIKKEKEFSS